MSKIDKRSRVVSSSYLVLHQVIFCASCSDYGVSVNHSLKLLYIVPIKALIILLDVLSYFYVKFSKSYRLISLNTCISNHNIT